MTVSLLLLLIHRKVDSRNLRDYSGSSESMCVSSLVQVHFHAEREESHVHSKLLWIKNAPTKYSVQKWCQFLHSVSVRMFVYPVLTDPNVEMLI